MSLEECETLSTRCKTGAKGEMNRFGRASVVVSVYADPRTWPLLRFNMLRIS